MKIVCLDDEKMALDAMCEVVNEIDEVDEIVGFNKVSLALDYLRKEGADIVITDIVMPVLTGFEFAEKVRSELGPKIYFIFVTGFSEVADEAEKMGKHGFVRKPVQYKELRREIDYYIETKK